MGQDAREAGAEARIRVYPDGVRSRTMDPARPRRDPGAFTHPCRAPAGQRSGDRHHQYSVTERLSGYARYSQLDVSERRSEEHTSELQSRGHLVCRLLLEKKKERDTDQLMKHIF